MMPDEYIPRKDVLKVIYTSTAPALEVKAMPAADVVEVRHGSWHQYSKGSGSYNGVIILSDAFQCTVCKKSSWNKSDYCPNCGAKMDEE